MSNTLLDVIQTYFATNTENNNFYTHAQDSIKNKKIRFLENFKKFKNIPIQSGGFP